MIMRSGSNWQPPDGEVRRDERLENHTTFAIGGPADWFVIAVSEADVRATLEFAAAEGQPLFILGGGSNVLFPDEGFRGVILTLSGALAEIEFEGSKVRAGAGALLPRVGLLAGKRGLSGLEFASGIPGQVGGTVFMNAGTRDSSVGPLVERVRVSDRTGRILELTNEECGFRYRNSNLKEYVVLRAEMRLSEVPAQEVRAKSQAYRRERIESQPVGTRNAGCVFKNPQGQSAGQLVDRLGLKGLRIGDAMVSPVHANFIINLGSATAEDVRSVMKEIQRRVAAETGIRLEPEVYLVGEERSEGTD